jgi:hypothetical protein
MGQSVSWQDFLMDGNWLVLASLPVIAMCLWLIGLMIVLRGTKPSERPPILRAFALCRPWGYAGLKRAPEER